MSRKSLVPTVAAVATALVVFLGLVLWGGSSTPPAPAAAPGSVPVAQGAPLPPPPPEVLVRPDSHRLTEAADGRVTLVEFLDFECEACGAIYPAIEELRAEYAGRITYVVRYFPIASHPNADLAARAAQAAANQGRFEPMYRALFDNQATWGHRDEPQREVFTGYAASLGLDTARFAADLDAPETAARVAADQADGDAAGVQGTPTLFLDGQRFEPSTVAELRGGIDAALAG